MMPVILNLNCEQFGWLDQVAVENNMNREEAVKRALERMALLDEVGPETYASIMRGKADADAGRFVPQEEMRRLFERFKAGK